MKNKKPAKPYWEMTTAELSEATKQFDEEFVGDKARPMTPEMMGRRMDMMQMMMEHMMEHEKAPEGAAR